jgi:hypothetical protein
VPALARKRTQPRLAEILRLPPLPISARRRGA